MIVCVCNAVTEAEIRACVELGCTDLDAVREAVGVASCCGTCADCAREVIESCHAARLAGALEAGVESIACHPNGCHPAGCPAFEHATISLHRPL